MSKTNSGAFTVKVKAVPKNELESALRVLLRSFEVNSIVIRKSEEGSV